jgi:hypothetical protein
MTTGSLFKMNRKTARAMTMAMDVIGLNRSSPG